MNKILLILILVGRFHSIVAQDKISKQEAERILDAVLTGNDDSKKLYDLGNEFFAKKNYEKADSLFTVSIKLIPHPDTYFNRAVCRRRMNDFSGYCTDIAAAANMGDKESYSMYCKECAKIDTVYTSQSNELVSKQDFEFATFITDYKYNTNRDYEKYDRAGNMILSYIIMGIDTIYLRSNNVTDPVYSGGYAAIEDYIKTKTNFYNHVNSKKMQGKINLALTIGNNGKIRRVKVLLGLRDGSSDSLARALYSLMPFEPAKYNGVNVKYQSQISIDFANNSLIVYEKRPYYKVFNLIQSLSDSTKYNISKKEEMPEFGGGPADMMKFIQNNVKMPQILKIKQLGGKCVVRFVVGTDGLIYNIEITKGLPGCAECEAEAIRVVKLMPKWKPATQNGKPVAVFFNLPINFQLR